MVLDGRNFVLQCHAVPFDPDRQHRRSIRFQNQDYSRVDLYFVTVCVQGREHLLSEIVDGKVVLSPAGRIVDWAWNDLPKHYPHVRLDAFVVMPNHVHGVLEIMEADLPRRHALPEVMRAFKSFSARRINRRQGTPGAPVWQRTYYDRILRDTRELEAVRRYIAENPTSWHEDLENRGLG